jgi:hypothetical protein
MNTWRIAVGSMRRPKLDAVCAMPPLRWRAYSNGKTPLRRRTARIFYAPILLGRRDQKSLWIRLSFR